MKAEKKLELKRRSLKACAFCFDKFDSRLFQCPSCRKYNLGVANSNDSGDQTVLLSEVSPTPLERIRTGPWDKCFGGPKEEDLGIVTTSVNLIGGVPGAGKSTMSLQLADEIANATKREIIYIGAEESPEEIAYRARRLNMRNMNLVRVHPMGSSADLGTILTVRKPCAVILDSLPGLVSDPEDAAELCKRFKDYCVTLKAPVIVIDHVTKQEDFAGLMKLQHAVDATFILNCDRRDIRQLTTIKNRFGPSNVSVRLEMTEKGLFLGNNAEEEDEETDEDWEEDEE